MSERNVRWGLLGAGHIAGSAYVPAIRQARNGTLHAVGSRTAAKAETFAAQHEIPCSHGSYEALLADPDVDAVYIALPNSLHAEWSIRALEAGKAVLCEKPLCLNASEARQMAEAAARCGRLLAEAFMFRFHPLTQRVRELVTSGRLGAIRTLHSSFHATTPGDNNIRMNPALGGGALLDLGAYCVNWSLLMVGSSPTAVQARSVHGPSGVDVATSALLEFPGGTLATFSCAMQSAFECSYEIVGQAGRLRVDHGALVAWPGGAFSINLWTGDTHESLAVPAANHYQLIVEAFGDAVSGQAPFPYPLEDSIASMSVIDAIRAAAR